MTQLQSNSRGDWISPLGPRLAATYEGGDPDLLGKIVPLVDFIEIVPDTLARSLNGKRSISGDILTQLRDLPPHISLIAHGVGLSVGSHEGYSQDYLHLLDQLVAAVDVAWHSEHLGYVNADGVNLGTMLPLPRTEEALDLVSERINEIQQRYDLPFLLENVAHVLPTFGEAYSPAGLLNALVERTGCYLLLDIYNLECDVKNHGLDLDRFLDELNLDAVWEIHLANGVEHRGLKLDVHSELTQQSTLDIARDVVLRAPQVRAVTYEFLSQAVPVLGYDAIEDELQRIREQVLC